MHESETSKQLDGKQEAPSDSELQYWVAEAARGKRVYQRRIYEYLAPRIYGVVRRIVGEVDADDVMQDFVIHLFSKLNQFRFESSLETWAHRMAVNQALQQLRKKRRESERVQKMADEVTFEAKQPANVAHEEAEILSAAMQKISGEQRALLHMKEVDGMGYEAIANVLGIPEGTVGSRLNKARKDLRTSLLSLGWEV